MREDKSVKESIGSMILVLRARYETPDDIQVEMRVRSTFIWHLDAFPSIVSQGWT